MPDKRKKAGVRTLVFGLMSLGLYAAVFSNSTAVAKFCALGKWNAIYPILAVFLFSFVHGAFASSLWTFVGIEARTKPKPTVEKDKREETRKRPRPQPQLQA